MTYTSSTGDFTVEKHFDRSYFKDESGPLWLPPKADFTVTIGKPLSIDAPLWRLVELELKTGPDALYAYYPFTVRVYVNGRLESVLEFDAADQLATATLRLPYGRPTKLSVVSELSSAPVNVGLGTDDRPLSVQWNQLRVVGSAQPRNHRPPVDVTTQEVDYHFSFLVEQLSKPVFVVGAYRSGTSVLTWAIGQHPNILPLDETSFLPLLTSGAMAGFNLAQTASRSFFETYRISSDEFFATIGNAIDNLVKRASRRRFFDATLKRISKSDPDFDPNFQIVRSEQSPKRRWVDGTPENSLAMSILRKTFPLAKFIHVIRHPFDVAASMAHFSRAGGREVSVSEGLEVWYRLNLAAATAARAFGPEVVLIVRADKLFKNTQEAMREIFEFLDEPDFPKAAQTYARRINSSTLSQTEREAAFAEIEASGLGTQELALYDELQTMADEGWNIDEAAKITLEEFDNDIIQRLTAIWS